MARRGWESVTPSDDIEAAAWIGERLHGFAQDVGSVIPEGFAAYARIFHPAWRSGYPDMTEVKWSEVAGATGRVVHPEMQFHAIAQPAPSNQLQPIWDGEPRTGMFPESQGAVLAEILARHTSTPNLCWFCLWEGYGYLHPGGAVWLVAFSGPFARVRWWRHSLMQWWRRRPVLRRPEPRQPTGPRVRLPHRDYLLLKGSVAQGAGWEDGPNLWWPDDRAWCVASEIDFPYTYVGGTEHLIDEILANPALEAMPAKLDHKITADGDTINS